MTTETLKSLSSQTDNNQIYTHFVFKLVENQDEYQIYRLNSILNRKMVFKNLKNKLGQTQYYNIISSFYHFEEYSIDLIDKLHKEWGLNMLDQNILTEFPVLEDENGIEELMSDNNLMYFVEKTKILSLNIQKNDLFYNKDRVNNKEYDLKSLDFHQYLSKQSALPIDNRDPYVEDLIDYAKKESLQILVIGKPKLGKTTFCKDLAKLLDIYHIEFGILLDRIIQKLKLSEENPELDEEGQPKDPLNQLEREIINEIKQGQAVSNEFLLELLNNELENPLVIQKGFVLDIPLYDNRWVNLIIDGGMKLPQDNCRFFTHIIDLIASDEEINHFASNIKENQEDFGLYSQLDRYLLSKPKVINEDEPVPDEEEEKKPLIEFDLLIRPNEILLENPLNIYNTKIYPMLKEIFSFMSVSQYINIPVSGLTSIEISSIVISKLGPEVYPLRPLPIKLEPGTEGNLKELLSQNIEEGSVIRKWSSFYQIDPVELFNGKVIVGKAEFPCEYAGRVFLFDKEENLIEFTQNARKYLKTKPKMPIGYNVSLVGPPCSGKKTYAELLNKLYGWKIIDIDQIVTESINEQKTWTSYNPSNPIVKKIKLTNKF